MTITAARERESFVDPAIGVGSIPIVTGGELELGAPEPAGPRRARTKAAASRERQLADELVDGSWLRPSDHPSQQLLTQTS